MAKKIIGFEIDIKGTPSTVRAIADLKKELKGIEQNIKESSDPAELKKLDEQYKSVTANVKALQDEQKKQIRDFKTAAETGTGSLQQLKNRVADLKKEYASLSEEQRQGAQGQEIIKEQVRLQAAITKTSEEIRKQTRDFRTAQDTGEGSYKQLSNRLNDLRKQYQNLSAAERNSPIGQALVKDIQKLDKELKAIDGTLGQFQRNVGNYPKVVKQFVRGAIPGFQAFEQTLESVGVSAGALGNILTGGFLLFQVGAAVARAGAAFLDFVGEVNKARESVANFTGFTGDALDEATARSRAIARTFEADLDEVTQAAVGLANELGIGYSEALDLIEKGFTSGANAAGDFLQSIEGNEKALRDLSQETDEFAVRQRNALDAQKELQRAQVELGKRFSDGASELQAFGDRLQAGVINLFLDFLDLIEPLTSAIGRLFGAYRGLGESVGLFSKQNEDAEESTSFLSTVIGAYVGVMTFLTNTISGTVEAVSDFIARNESLQSVVNGVRAVFNGLLETIKSIPAILAGVSASFAQFWANITGQAQSADDIQNEVSRLRGLGLSDAEIQAEIAKQSQAGRSVGAAFQDAYNAQVQAGEARARKTVIEEQELIVDSVKESNAEREKAQKELEARLKKIAEERKRFQDAQLQREQQNIQLLLTLQRRLTDAQLQAIEGETTRALKIEREAQKRREEDLRSSYEGLRKTAEAEERRLVEVFGRNSKEVAKFREQSGRELAAALIAQEQLIEQERANSVKRIQKITSEANRKRIEEEKKAAEELLAAQQATIEGSISLLDKELNLRTLKIEEQRARGVLKAKEAAEAEAQARITTLREQLQKIAELEAEFGSSDIIVQRRQELNTKLAQLEEKQTAKVIEEANKRSEARQKSFEQGLDVANKGIDQFAKIADGLNKRQLASVEENIQSIVQTRNELQEQLQEATGLEKRFLEERIQANISAEGSLQAEKERLQQQQARRNKAVALAQAGINTALAVSSALATPPGPPITIPNAILAGILGAAQVAAIAAAPAFAQGGLVGKANMRPRPNGDNVLATVKTGEVVLNRKQQSALGGAATFAKIGVPGFATGGLVGRTQLTPPIVRGSSASEELVNMLARQGDKKVVLVAEDVYQDENDLGEADRVRLIS